VSISTPSSLPGGVGTLYQPVPVVASNNSTSIDTGFGSFLGYTVFNTTGGAATFRFHDGQASGTLQPLTAMQTVAASSGTSAWFGPQGLLVGTGIWLERISGSTEFVVYGV